MFVDAVTAKGEYLRGYLLLIFAKHSLLPHVQGRIFKGICFLEMLILQVQGDMLLTVFFLFLFEREGLGSRSYDSLSI
jgi:hypothetical protein